MKRTNDNPCSSGGTKTETPEKTKHGENIKSFFATHISFTKKGVGRTNPFVDRTASDEGIEDEPQEENGEGSKLSNSIINYVINIMLFKPL